LVVLLGSSFIYAGITIIRKNKSVTVDIDRAAGVVELIYSGIFKKDGERINFSQIKEVAVEAYFPPERSGRNAVDKSHDLVFYTTDGRKIPVHISIGSRGFMLLGFDIFRVEPVREIEIGRAVSDLIGVKFSYRDAQTMKDIIKEHVAKERAKRSQKD
jgi:hypothetical protein